MPFYHSSLCLCPPFQFLTIFSIILAGSPPSEQIIMVNDKNGKPRGYAFIEFEHERDLNCKSPPSCHFHISLFSSYTYLQARAHLPYLALTSPPPLSLSLFFFFKFLPNSSSYFVPAAFRHADGKKIEGRRIVVDVERARTVKDFFPRRLGTLYHRGQER